MAVTPRVIVVGEILADLAVPDITGAASPPAGEAVLTLHARPGGSPANVAIGLARLGIPVAFAGRLSPDGLGRWLGDHLAAAGVDLSLSVPASEPPSLALVTLDKLGGADYLFYGPGTADWQWRPAELPNPVAAGAAAVHTGSLAAALGPGAAVLLAWARRARDHGRVLVSYDPNVRPALSAGTTTATTTATTAAAAEEWVKASHLVKASQDDLALLYPARPALDAAAGWARLGPELVIVTRGAGGSVAIRPDGTRRARPAPLTQVVDTVGAGDAFTAALLAWLAEADALHPGGPAGLDDAALGAALDTAGVVAAHTCGRPGADPPRRDEVTAAPWP